MRDTGGVSVFVHSLGVTTVASSSDIAVDHNLSVKTDGSFGDNSVSVIVDVKSISNGRG